MICIDLHTHSTASDGSLSPSEIVRLALSKKLGAIALTDHDTVSGIEEFLGESAKLDVNAVPGVEVSVMHENSIHITGLFIDYKNENLQRLLCEIRKNRDSRNILIVAKLEQMGYKITLEEIESVAKGESVGRPHIAKILIGKGYFKQSQDVFDKCLKKGMPAYCPRILPEPGHAIRVIHEAGGIAIWAHPLHRSENSVSYVENILQSLIKLGLDGIEAYYSTFTREQQDMLLKVAGKHGLAVSGGSDFHGDNMSGVDMGAGFGGLSVPFSVYTDLLQRIQRI